MSVYKRENSKYYWFKFHFDGDLIQQSSKCTSKVKAGEVEAAFRHQLVLGRIGIKPKVKAPAFDEAVKDFLEWSKIEHALQDATYKRYFYSCQVIKKFFGKTKADKIAATDIEKFITWRSNQESQKTGKPITRETVNHELMTIKIIFNRLIEKDVLSKNPAKVVKRLSENERKFHVLTLTEELAYLLASPQPLQDVAILMLESGMRCGEVYNLQRQDVSLEKGFLKVIKGKTKSSVRNVHLSEKAKDVLRHRLKKFKGKNLFPQADKDFEKPTDSLNKQHRATIKKLGFDFRLYDCRHTFATRAVENSIDLVVLASILGHSSLRMVMRYSHPSETFKADAIRRMETAKAKAV